MASDFKRKLELYFLAIANDKVGGMAAFVPKIFLYLLSLLYGLVISVLAFFWGIFRYKASCKVISVGNITLGGTGKTSLVEYIAKYLQAKGHKVAVLSRGYKRKTAGEKCSCVGHEEMGDEPFMLSRNLPGVPVIASADRVACIKKALCDYGVDTVILDDGFQQWRIKKDLDIVTIDSTNPFGNGKVIPRGILREPLSSLKRADIFVITKTNLHSDAGDVRERVRNFNLNSPIVGSTHEPVGFYELDDPDKMLPVDVISYKTAALVSGIGEPKSFEALARGLWIKIGSTFEFDDHHHYTKEEFGSIIAECKAKNIDIIITTEKDAAKIKGLNINMEGLRVLVMRLEIKLTRNQELFYDRLLRVYSL